MNCTPAVELVYTHGETFHAAPRAMKIIACAYACNPFHGSEDGVGWGWVNAIAKHHEVWVLTAGYHRFDLEEALRRQPDIRDRLHFVYVEEKPWHYRPTPVWIKIENSVVKPIMNWAYRLWLRDAFVLGERLHHEIGFDLTHQIAYVGFRFPGHLWKLDIPFVWGPIGGLENTPWRLLPAIGARGALYYAARNSVNSLHKRFLYGPQRAFAKAGVGAIAATSSIQNEIARRYRVSSRVICEIGIEEDPEAKLCIRAANDPLKLSWSGQHLPGKALHLLPRVLSRLSRPIDWQLDIYGNGPCKPRWQRLAITLGIEPRCRWYGRVPRAEALAGLKSTHLFVTTSLKDLTSSVILEAMSNGVPVVCPDHCGFADVVDGTCGIKIPIVNVRDFETGLGRAIVAIASDETMRRRLAQGAILRARDYSWDSKAEAIDRLYDRVLSRTYGKEIDVSRTLTEASGHSTK